MVYRTAVPRNLAVVARAASNRCLQEHRRPLGLLSGSPFARSPHDRALSTWMTTPVDRTCQHGSRREA